MSGWTLLQVVFDLFCLASIIMMGLRLRKPPQDDPRLSRGLQLLQTKITILEDLSDRTENQVKQLTGLLDQKTRFLQNKILEGEQQILKIDHSMQKSLEVAEIFQDKIPHTEILERQRTVEYVKAARLAHSGLDLEEIVRRVRLPREQIELIAKFNREQLMFDETQLPEWATQETESGPSFAMNSMDFVGNLEKPKDLSNLNKVEENFRQAVESARREEAQQLTQAQAPASTPIITPEPKIATPPPAAPVAAAEPARNQVVGKDSIAHIKKVVFPRIEKPT